MTTAMRKSTFIDVLNARGWFARWLDHNFRKPVSRAYDWAAYRGPGIYRKQFIERVQTRFNFLKANAPSVYKIETTELKAEGFFRQYPELLKGNPELAN